MKQRLISGVDPTQLREEFTGRGLTVTVGEPDGQSKVSIEYADDLNEEVITAVLIRHFPKSHVAGILAVDFEGAVTLADLRTRCIQLRNRTALALKARWETS
jgi:hypothetical protein